MPIYEYQCGKCEHEFEREQRITEDPVKTCPKCRSRRVKKLISQTSFVLKGGGWYSDLYSSTKSDGDSKDGKDGKDGKEGKDGKKDKSSKDGDPKDTSSSDSKDAGKKKKKKSSKSAA